MDKQSLIGLAYCSTASFASGKDRQGVDPELSRILILSRRNNRQREIGGVLHFGNGYFFQYLEGNMDQVDALYGRICRDNRHTEVVQLVRRPLSSRLFADWSMKFVAIEEVIERVLRKHGKHDFNPYHFTPEVIDDLLTACVHGDDVGDALIAGSAQPSAKKATSGWRSRLKQLIGLR
ncbi:MAG: hypothetical protein Tsb002_11430 [Wenzhouxiangellaceae bacterium]